jgi:hypothetical protein
MQKMKKVILFFFITAGLSISAQEPKMKLNKSLDLSYYSTDVGTNICAEYNFNFEKQSLYIGVKCHINRYIKESGYAYHHQFYADHPLEFIGVSLGYKYFLKDINPYVSPYIVYNFQYANLWTKNRFINDYGSQFVIIDGPYHTIENCGGLGLKVKLTERLYLNQSAGIGVAMFYSQQPRSTSVNAGVPSNQQRGSFTNNWAWEFMYQWRLGLSMKLN